MCIAFPGNRKHPQLVRLVHLVYCYKETDKCDRSITAILGFGTRQTKLRTMHYVTCVLQW